MLLGTRDLLAYIIIVNVALVWVGGRVLRHRVMTELDKIRSGEPRGHRF